MKRNRKSIILIVFSFLQGLSAYGFQERMKASFEKEIEVNRPLSVKSSFQELEITSWNEEKLSIDFEIVYKKKYASKLADVDLNKILSNTVSVKSDTTFLTLSGLIAGYQQVREKGVQIRIWVKVPAQCGLHLKTTEDQAEFNGFFDSNVTLESYKSVIRGEDFKDLMVKDSYGTLDVKSAVNITVDAYHSKIDVARVDLIQGELSYGSIRLAEEVNEARIVKLHQTEVTVKKANKLNIKKSFESRLTLKTVNDFNMEESSKDIIRIAEAKNIELNPNYGALNVETLTNELKIDRCYQQKVSIGKVQEATNIAVVGSYVSVDIEEPKKTSLLDISVSYLKLNYTKSNFTQLSYSYNEDKFLTKTKLASKLSGEPKLNITIAGYDIKLNIN